MNKKEIISALRHEVTEDGHILLDRLEALLRTDAWLPEGTFAAAVRVFGSCMYAPTGKTRMSLARRVGHAYEVWTEKYGSLNAEQEAYADEVLAACIRRADHTDNPFAAFQYQIGQAVNHERVHEGFKRRGGLRKVEIA